MLTLFVTFNPTARDAIASKNNTLKTKLEYYFSSTCGILIWNG